MSPRLRLTIGVCASLALGAATALAVACAGALIGADPNGDSSEPIAVTSTTDYSALILRDWQESWFIHAIAISRGLYTSVDADQIEIRIGRSNGRYRRMDVSPFRIHPMPSWADNRLEYHIGWPAACLRGAADSHDGGSDMVDRMELDHIVRVWPRDATSLAKGGGDIWYFHTSRINPCRYLPTGLLPFGLAIDTLVFAPVWAVLMFFPGVLRRAIRRRRNHCPKCNYNLHGLAPDSKCPECGRTPARTCP